MTVLFFMLIGIDLVAIIIFNPNKITLRCFINFNNLKPILDVKILFFTVKIGMKSNTKQKKYKADIDIMKLLKQIYLDKFNINIALSNKNNAETAFYALMISELFSFIEHFKPDFINYYIKNQSGASKINISLSIKISVVQILKSIKSLKVAS